MPYEKSDEVGIFHGPHNLILRLPILENFYAHSVGGLKQYDNAWQTLITVKVLSVGIYSI